MGPNAFAFAFAFASAFAFACCAWIISYEVWKCIEYLHMPGGGYSQTDNTTSLTRVVALTQDVGVWTRLEEPRQKQRKLCTMILNVVSCFELGRMSL